MARNLETDSLSNQNISAALEIGSYTAAATRLLFIRVLADQVAGNGDYVCYATLQVGGAGSAYRLIPITTAAAASGVTAIGFLSIGIPVDSGDIVKVYITGLAGDTTTPDTRVDFYENDYLRPTTAGRTLDVAADGAAEANLIQVNGVAQTATLDTIAAQVSASAPTATTATAGSATSGTVVSGTFAATQTQNSTYWQIAATGAAVVTASLTYACGTGKLANTVRVVGRYQVNGSTANKYVNVQAYNYKTAVWDTVSSSTTRLNGQTGATDNTYTFPLTVDHMDVTGAAQIRFVGSDVTATSNLYLDYVPYLYQTNATSTDAIAQAVYLKLKNTVYENGVWIDTVNGVAGTVVGDNGTAWNPCLTYADALVIAAALGVKRIYLRPASSITLTQDHTGWRFIGAGSIALNGQVIANAVFENVYTITGLSSGDDAEFRYCGIGTCTIAHAYFESCMFRGAMTLVTGDAYYLHSCSDAVEGGTTSFTFAANANLYLRDWRGGVALYSLAAGSECIIDGAGRIILDATCVGGTLTVRGHFTAITGSAAYILAGGTIGQAARWATDQLGFVWDESIAAHLLAGSTGKTLNDLTPAGAVVYNAEITEIHVT